MPSSFLVRRIRAARLHAAAASSSLLVASVLVGRGFGTDSSATSMPPSGMSTPTPAADPLPTTSAAPSSSSSSSSGASASFADPASASLFTTTHGISSGFGGASNTATTSFQPYDSMGDGQSFKLYCDSSTYGGGKGGGGVMPGVWDSGRTFSSASPLSYNPSVFVGWATPTPAAAPAIDEARQNAQSSSGGNAQGSHNSTMDASAAHDRDLVTAEDKAMRQQQNAAGAAAAAMSAAAAQQQQQLMMMQMGMEKKMHDTAPPPIFTQPPPIVRAVSLASPPPLRFISTAASQAAKKGKEKSVTAAGKKGVDGKNDMDDDDEDGDLEEKSDEDALRADRAGVEGEEVALVGDDGADDMDVDEAGYDDEDDGKSSGQIGAAGASQDGKTPEGSGGSVVRSASGVTVTVRDEMRKDVSVQALRHFSDIAEDLTPWLNAALQESGFDRPTVVQSVTIPLFLEGHDVVGIAPTGSGKTVAFAVPALASSAQHPVRDTRGEKGGKGASPTEPAMPRVLVLCPTRELVQQTHRVFVALTRGNVPVRAAFGGSDREVQARRLLHEGCGVLVAAPGRLCDFVESGVVSLAGVDFLVLDEADRMLEMGFATQLEFIMSTLKRAGGVRQTTMWSATWNATVSSLASRFLRTKRLMVEVRSQQATCRDVTQLVYPLADPSERLGAIVKLYDNRIINKKEQVIIFCNKKETVDSVVRDLVTALRIPPDLLQGLHGGLKQRKREAIIHRFREGQVRILVATDVAARGLDVPALDHVINFDLPNDTDIYVHRVGRTGRAGRKGTAHTLLAGNDIRVPTIARFIARQTGMPMSEEVHDMVTKIERHGGSDYNRRKYVRHATLHDGADWKRTGSVQQDQTRYTSDHQRVYVLNRPRSNSNSNNTTTTPPPVK